MKTTETLAISVLALGVMVCQANVIEAATPMGTAFTYQERLMDADQPLDGFYDLQFKLFDDPDVILGVQVGSTIDIGGLVIMDGQITVELDFGSGVFNGDARWLEIGERPGEKDDPEVYTVLMPRIELKPVPYALHTRGIFLDDDYPNNTFVGIGAGYTRARGDYTFGCDNTFLGYEAGFVNTTGYHNTFLGSWAGHHNTAGNNNTFVGSCAGYYTTNTAEYNTFIGCDAGYYNTTGGYNTFLGYQAGFNNTTGPGNTFVGHCAGYNSATGNSNTCVGYYAGANISIGHRNTCLGMRAGRENYTGSGNVFVGYEAGKYETGSNKLYIANGPSDPNVLIYGDFSAGRVGISTTNPGSYKLAVNGSAAKPGGGSWSNFSDIRLKKLDGNYERGLSEVCKLSPIRYSYRQNNELELPTDKEFVGVVSQEVQTIIPEAVEENDNGYLMVNNDPIIWAMVNAVKQLNTQNEELRAENMKLMQRLEALEKTMAQHKLAVAKEVQQ